MDKEGHVTHLDRFRRPHQETTLQIVKTVGRTMALVDSTGTGDAVVENLQRRGDMRVLGFTFTERSRQELLEGLALAIQGEEIRWPDQYTSDGRGSLREELESFEYEHTPRGVRYQVPEGVNDDLTMAAALAVKRMPWKRKVRLTPEGIKQRGGSKWTSEQTGDSDAWNKYQQSQKPTLSAPEEDPLPSVAMPTIATGATSGNRWTQAG